MNNEDYLLESIKTFVADTERKIEEIKNIPEGYGIPGFDDGNIAGRSMGLKYFKNVLKAYRTRNLLKCYDDPPNDEMC
jgi:hypothetical protein